MYLIIGLLIIAIGAFCQSSSYVPINKIKDWSWESPGPVGVSATCSP